MNFKTFLAWVASGTFTEKYIELDFALSGNEGKYFRRLLKDILTTNKMLEEVKITCNTNTNAFQDQHHQYFKQLSSKAKFAHLRKTTLSISLRILVVLLTGERLLRNREHIRQSTLYNTIRLLKNITKVEQAITINLNNLEINDYSFVKIMQTLATGNYPSHLNVNFAYNHIQDEGALWLIKILNTGKFNKPLFINLPYNEISEPVIVLLCRQLAKVPNVDIDLTGNIYNEAGQAAIDRLKLIKNSKPIMACLTLQQVNRLSVLPKLPQEILSEIFQFVYPTMQSSTVDDRKLFVKKIEGIDNQLLARRQHSFFFKKSDGLELAPPHPKNAHPKPE